MARRRAFFALLAADVLFLCTSDAPKLLPHGGELSRVFSVAMWTGLALALVLVTTRQTEPRGDLKPLNSREPQLT